MARFLNITKIVYVNELCKRIVCFCDCLSELVCNVLTVHPLLFIFQRPFFSKTLNIHIKSLINNSVVEIEVLKLTLSSQYLLLDKGLDFMSCLQILRPELSTYHTVINVHVFGFKCLGAMEEKSGKLLKIS